MPSGGGPVYQPTTVSVSYEPRSGGASGGGPLGLLGGPASLDSSLRVLRKPLPQVAYLLFTLILLAAGIAMITSGIAGYLQEKEELAAQQHIEDDESVSACVELPVSLLIFGAIMIVLGLIGFSFYIKIAMWRRHWVCTCPFFDKKQSLSRTLQCQGGGGCSQGIMALNPSTDPLVSHTQYAPVSELPSLRPEDEERRNLMPDSKDCLSSAEESDRMLEPDPRIVLRPMGRVEDA